MGTGWRGHGRVSAPVSIIVQEAFHPREDQLERGSRSKRQKRRGYRGKHVSSVTKP